MDTGHRYHNVIVIWLQMENQLAFDFDHLIMNNNEHLIFHRLKGSFNDVSFLCYGIWQRVRGVLLCGRDRPKIIRNFQAVSATDFNIVCHCPSGCRFIRGLTCVFHFTGRCSSVMMRRTPREWCAAPKTKGLWFFFLLLLFYFPFLPVENQEF